MRSATLSALFLLSMMLPGRADDVIEVDSSPPLLPCVATATKADCTVTNSTSPIETAIPVASLPSPVSDEASTSQDRELQVWSWNNDNLAAKPQDAGDTTRLASTNPAMAIPASSQLASSVASAEISSEDERGAITGSVSPAANLNKISPIQVPPSAGNRVTGSIATTGEPLGYITSKGVFHVQ
jgi:hypothetical protein